MRWTLVKELATYRNFLLHCLCNLLVCGRLFWGWPPILRQTLLVHILLPND